MALVFGHCAVCHWIQHHGISPLRGGLIEGQVTRAGRGPGGDRHEIACNSRSRAERIATGVALHCPEPGLISDSLGIRQAEQGRQTKPSNLVY